MAINERIEYTLNDIPFEQLAPIKANQTDFTPGRTDGKALDMNWPTEFRIPTGNFGFNEATNGPIEVERVRVIKLGRNIVCDQVLADVPSVPEETTQENDGRKERRTGFDWAKGA